jgi:hypothetical protein
MADHSQLRKRAQAGDPPPPGTRVVVARIAGEATAEHADRIARALVGLKGEIVENGDVPVDPAETATVKLDGADTPTHFSWDELELEGNWTEEG